MVPWEERDEIKSKKMPEKSAYARDDMVEDGFFILVLLKMIPCPQFLNKIAMCVIGENGGCCDQRRGPV